MRQLETDNQQETKLTVKYASTTLEDIIVKAERGEYLLPNFQRQFVWSIENHRALAASMLLRIPCGSLLVVKGKSSQFSSRRVGYMSSETAPTDNSQSVEFLLDGQQRVSTLFGLFADIFSRDWKGVHDQIFRQLKSRWALQIRPEKDQPDVFGWTSLRLGKLPEEPEILKEVFVQYDVFKTTKLDHWSHPAFMSNLEEAQRALKIGVAAAQDGQVPIWGLCGSAKYDNSVHDSYTKRALREIAESRRKELQAALEDNQLPEDILHDLVQPGEAASELTGEQISERLRDRQSDWAKDVHDLITDLRKAELSIIELTDDELPKAIAIFEAINRGGTPLTSFDLITARYARGESQKSLPEMIQEYIASFDQDVPAELRRHASQKSWTAVDNIGYVKDSLTNNFKTQFLTLIVMHNLLLARGNECSFTVDELKQRQALALKAEDIDRGWTAASSAFLETWRFLQLRCGVKNEGALRNKLLSLPIAVALSNPELPKSRDLYDKIEYWYWCSVLTGTYTARQNEHAIQDASDLSRWLRDPSTGNPFTTRQARVLKDPGYSDDETLLRSGEESSVRADVGDYLLQYVLAKGGRDLLKDRLIDVQVDEIEDHHLIPLGSASSIGQSSSVIRKGSSEIARLLNSPLNRAYILKESNRKISARPIDTYMKETSLPARASLYFPDMKDQFGGISDVASIRKLLASRLGQLRSETSKDLSRLSGE
ncbi:DUF262 domain-containing protein [Hoyosella subflava]|uniref:DUF262 domain-containing protein n=1 Tax=Hoyosella subflava TaxID=639313 RepID=UPI0013050DA3|nr:DUF262 domain-containing protein [Hoyosella subflava]